jgi:hypothetical protein
MKKKVGMYQSFFKNPTFIEREKTPFLIVPLLLAQSHECTFPVVMDTLLVV